MKLAETLVSDHEPFAHQGHPSFYFRLPSKPAIQTTPVSVTPTCTAWMALAAGRVKLEQSIYTAAFKQLMNEPWDTGRLPQNNAFTVAVVSRAIGFLQESHALEDNAITTTNRELTNHNLMYGANDVASIDKNSTISNDEPWRCCHNKTLPEILQTYLKTPDSSIALKPFPASPAIGYWLIDAALRLNVGFDQENAEAVAKWASTEFRRQHSLVSATDQAMDPVALAMAACMCKRFRRAANKSDEWFKALTNCLFPSDFELGAGIQQFFKYQNQAGIWEKYFPIFQYPASGPNHCWHFEVLEAVIGEFPDILQDLDVLEKLNRSLDWLQSNRRTYLHDGVTYTGWNAGGDIKAMRRGEPESWPTSVAHIFLATLNDQLSSLIHKCVLTKYGNRVRVFKNDNGIAWNGYMDFDFLEPDKCGIDATRNSVKKMIEKEILEPADSLLAKSGMSPHFRLNRRRSAVLYGPPGTSKTTLCEAVSARLGWPFLELSPSDFLGGGLDGVYDKVTEVFADLLDLHGVVILFDEMDALVQSRAATTDVQGKSNGQLDVTQQFLTTSMLPKLQKLRAEARTIFFMATNYFSNFDGAIVRSGRFDLLVHMGPPSTIQKIDGLGRWCKRDSMDDINAAKANLKLHLVDDTKERFDRFTYGETERFLYSLMLKRGANTEAAGILAAGADIKAEIKDWAASKITLSDNSDALKQYKDEANRVSIQ